MPKSFLRIFSFIFIARCLNIFSMKRLNFISLIVIGLYTSNAFGLGLLSASDIPASGYYTDILIAGGGNYNLSSLDNIIAPSPATAADVLINFDLMDGGLNAPVVLIADSGFDGAVNANFKFDKPTRISLTQDFLNNHGSDEYILRLNGNTSLIGDVNVSQDGDNVYDYEWVDCFGGTRNCVRRKSSVAQQNSEHEVFVARNSVQNNPEQLLRPMMVINHHELFGMYEFTDDVLLSVAPEYYMANNFQNLGLRLNMGTRIGGRLTVGVSGYITNSDYQNNVSGFKAGVYGGNLRVKYDLDEVLSLRGIAGISFAHLDCDGVRNGNTTVDNPNAFGVYSGLDFVSKFDFESGIYLSPFVGVASTRDTVVDVNKTNLFLHIGNDIGFKYFMDGVSYGYALRTGIDSHGYFDAGVGIDIWTVADKIGGSVSVGVMDTEFGWSGKVSGSVNFAF